MSKRVTRKSNKPKAPSASHYLGYVEDFESVDSIMKKFEALEKYKEKIINKEKENPTIKTENTDSITEVIDEKEDVKDKEKPQEEMLDEKHYEEMFNITSSYAFVRTIEEDLLNYDEDELDEWDNSLANESVEEDESFNEEEFFNEKNKDSEEEKKKRKLRRKDLSQNNGTRKNGTGRKRAKKENSEEGVGGGNLIPAKKEVTDENGYRFTIRKKTKKKDPLKEENVKIPKDTMAWARDILPYENKNVKPPGSNYMQVENIVSVDWSIPENNREGFLAILMDPPWKCQSKEGKGVDVEDLKKLKVPESVLFIFIWAEKEVIPGVVNLMEGWNFSYVENFVWVKKQVNNKFFTQESDYFRKSKMTLLIFRRNVKVPVELRHQRNPDVFFDFVKIKEGNNEDNRFSCYQRESKPLFVYHLIETLLPTGNYKETEGHGKFLHLWSDYQYYRKGWTTVYC